MAPQSKPFGIKPEINENGSRTEGTWLSILLGYWILERLRLNIHAEMINAFNHTNWGVPGPHGNSPADFMNIAGAPYLGASEVGGPRNIQFRTELTF